LQEFEVDFVDDTRRADSHSDLNINVQKECLAREENISESTSADNNIPCREAQKSPPPSSQKGVTEGGIKPDSDHTPPSAGSSQKSAEHFPNNRRVRFREKVEIQTYIKNNESGPADRCGDRRRNKSSQMLKPILKKRTHRRSAQGSTHAQAPESTDWSTVYMENDESRLMKDLLDLECYVSNGQARFQSLEGQMDRCVQRIR
jgi:hypothetical protein